MSRTNSPLPCIQKQTLAGQKVLYENHQQDLSKNQKLQQKRLGPFTVTKRVTKTTYQIQDDKDPSIIKTLRRNHFVECYPKEESLPAMIEEYVPHDKRHDDFYDWFMEQKIGKLNSFTEPLATDPIPFPIRLYLRLRQSLNTNVIASLAVTQELAHLKFFRQPYPLHLNNYHNIQKRR